MGLKDSVLCECGHIQTTEHIVEDDPFISSRRRTSTILRVSKLFMQKNIYLLQAYLSMKSLCHIG